jgi:hypothetical protein
VNTFICVIPKECNKMQDQSSIRVFGYKYILLSVIFS